MVEEKFSEVLSLVHSKFVELRDDFNFAHVRSVQALELAQTAHRAVLLARDTTVLTRRLLA